jgi:hypothetical protein
VIQRALSEAKNATTSATSSGFPICTTHELALDQATILQFQGIGPCNRGRQTQRNDQSAIQLELHHDFSSVLTNGSNGRMQLKRHWMWF